MIETSSLSHCQTEDQGSDSEDEAIVSQQGRSKRINFTMPVICAWYKETCGVGGDTAGGRAY